MAQNYTRQSSFADGDTITASLFNNEYNQLVNAFTYSSTDVDATGHRHDGTSGEGGNIYRIGDLNFLNKIEADSVNNRWGFFVEVSSTAVEQIRIQDGVILPVITNDIDLGSASLQFKDGYFDGTINSDSLVLSSGSTVTAILDEDNLVSDSATALATQQSIKAYVDAQVTAQDLDFQGDTGGALSIDLDSETLTIAGGTGIDTAGATNTLTVSIDSTVATLTGTQTLTNKTINADNNTVSNLEVDNLKTGVLDTDISSVAGTHTTLPSALAVKTYVDAQVTAQDLDIFGDTGTDSIDLDSETLTFTGGTGITSVVTAGTVTHNIDSTVATLTGTQTLTNKTLTSPTISGNLTTDGNIDGRDVAADGTKLDGIEASADVTDTANVTAAGALMDSELTNITAIKALNQGVATTDSPTFAGATLTTTDINGGTIDGTVIGGSSAAAGSFTNLTATGTTTFAGASTTATINFPDGVGAYFGTGNDLQIYHSGTESIIADAGTGNLNLRGQNQIVLATASGSETYAAFNVNGASQLYYDNAAKLATASTGIDVTGTVTADGLTFSGTLLGSAASGGFIKLKRDDTTLTNNADVGAIDFETTDTDDAGVAATILASGDGSAGGVKLRFYTGTASDKNERFLINANGDISFYEDTGTTAKLFWDASAESLGIGTTSPEENLHINSSSGSARIRMTSADGSDNMIVFGDASDSATGSIKFDHSDNSLAFFGFNNSERMRIDSSGLVGIGNSSPSSYNSGGNRLVVGSGSGFQGITIASGSAQSGNLYFADGTTGDEAYRGHITYDHSDDHMHFKTAGTERMRINSAGDWMVSNTVANVASNYSAQGGCGWVESDNHFEIATTSDRSVLEIGKNNANDGTIITFRKQSTPVGSIGTVGGALVVGSGDTGLLFDGSGDYITPRNASTQAGRDAAIDLGTSSDRFKDLYLSGGVYLGGTSAANKLDYYEEGTFTPTVVGSATAGTATYSHQKGVYTKIGNQVTIQVYVNWSSGTGTGVLQITNLPFTLFSSSGYYPSGAIGEHYNITGTAGHTLGVIGLPNTNTVQFAENDFNSTPTTTSYDASGYIIFSMTYIAA